MKKVYCKSCKYNKLPNSDSWKYCDSPHLLFLTKGNEFLGIPDKEDTKVALKKQFNEKGDCPHYKKRQRPTQRFLLKKMRKGKCISKDFLEVNMKKEEGEILDKIIAEIIDSYKKSMKQGGSKKMPSEVAVWIIENTVALTYKKLRSLRLLK